VRVSICRRLSSMGDRPIRSLLLTSSRPWATYGSFPWTGIVRNDLRLAEATLGECGVIALDDFLRAEWPDVSTGYFEWLRERSRPIVPFAIGFNKLYLCEERYRALYRKVLDDSSFLKVFLSRHYDFGGTDIYVYQKFALPEEWNLRTRIEEYIKLYHPDLYVRLRAARSSRRR
jgi:hypothetical protein